MEHVVQFVGANPARISDYHSEAHVPALLKTPLTREEYADFVNSDRIATFTLGVPLAIVAEGEDMLSNYVQDHAFDGNVGVQSVEARAVGASFGEFDRMYCGTVHLQITCGLHDNID